jgi:hypothetical protein
VDPSAAQSSAISDANLLVGDEITVTEEALAAFNAAFKKAEYQLHSPREGPRRRLSACSHVTFNAAITGPDGCAVDVRALQLADRLCVIYSLFSRSFACPEDCSLYMLHMSSQLRFSVNFLQRCTWNIKPQLF